MADTFDTIIHLVSDQTMQNVLPILALRPRRVIQVHSPSQSFVAKAQHTRDAVALAQQTVPTLGKGAPAIEWEKVALHNPFPGLADTAAVIRPMLARGELGRICVNYTGGTKNMSIGAWNAANEAGAATLYCDTPRAFLSGGTGEISFPAALKDVAVLLNCQVVLASRGLLQTRDWNNKSISDHELNLGSTGYRLLQVYRGAFRAYRASLAAHEGLDRLGRRQQDTNVQSLVDATNRIISKPVEMPPARFPLMLGYLEAAEKCGFVRRNEGRWFIGTHDDLESDDCDIRVERLIRVRTGLVGGAFEAFVAQRLNDSMKADGRFTDVLANVEASTDSVNRGSGMGETDFLVYSPSDIGLTLISCKCTPPLLEHLEAIVARRARLGGLNARSLLCVEWSWPRRRDEVSGWCRSLQIDCAFSFVDGSEQVDLVHAFKSAVTKLPMR